MKKKKFFASALAAVICGSVCACSLPASALWYGEQELEIPDGYTEVANLEGCYQQIGEDLTGLFTFDCYYTNFTKIIIPATTEATETFYEIYANYEAEIGADECMVGYTVDSGENYSVRIYETEYVFCKDLATAKEKELKEDVILQLCQDLQDAGIVIDATYMPHAATPSYGYYYQYLNFAGINADAVEDIAAIATQYDTDADVQYVSEDDNAYISITGVEDFDIALSLKDEICATYPDAIYEDTNYDFMESFGGELFSTASIDLLAEEITLYGDMDGDEEIMVQDAYTCMCAFAEVSAGNNDGLTDSQRTAADVNGDGEIMMQDAYLIQMYAANVAAGKDVTWDDLIG